MGLENRRLSVCETAVLFTRTKVRTILWKMGPAVSGLDSCALRKTDLRRLGVITRKTVEVELRFQGNGRVVQRQPGHFVGGVPDPRIGKDLTFTVHRQVSDEDGLFNPVAGEEAMQGSLQINVYGNSKGYRELGKYLLALAELDTTEDEGFHEHHDELISSDGRTHLHVILRKRDRRSHASSRR